MKRNKVNSFPPRKQKINKKTSNNQNKQKTVVKVGFICKGKPCKQKVVIIKQAL